MPQLRRKQGLKENSGNGDSVAAQGRVGGRGEAYMPHGLSFWTEAFSLGVKGLLACL